MVKENAPDYEDEEDAIDTSEMSQAEYVAAIQRMLAPAIERTMRLLPPPDNQATTGAAAYIQALTQFAFDITNALGIHPIEFTRALQIMAADIEMATVSKMAAILEGENKKGKKAPAGEAKIDF